MRITFALRVSCYRARSCHRSFWPAVLPSSLTLWFFAFASAPGQHSTSLHIWRAVTRRVMVLPGRLAYRERTASLHVLCLLQQSRCCLFALPTSVGGRKMFLTPLLLRRRNAAPETAFVLYFMEDNVAAAARAANSAVRLRSGEQCSRGALAAVRAALSRLSLLPRHRCRCTLALALMNCNTAGIAVAALPLRRACIWIHHLPLAASSPLYGENWQLGMRSGRYGVSRWLPGICLAAICAAGGASAACWAHNALFGKRCAWFGIP